MDGGWRSVRSADTKSCLRVVVVVCLVVACSLCLVPPLSESDPSEPA